MAYRLWCGECSFKTGWVTQSQGEEQQIQHYAKHHPGIPPGGSIETKHSEPSGGGGLGCLPMLGILVLFLFLAASCRR